MEVVRSVTCLIQVNERKLGIFIFFKTSARGIVILRGLWLLEVEYFRLGLIDVGESSLSCYPIYGCSAQHNGFLHSQASPLQTSCLW